MKLSWMKIFITVVLLLSFGFEGFSTKPKKRTFNNNYSFEAKYSPGIDTKRDSVSISMFRAKMRNIRRKRPSVALVLSGGGAKGAAHVGVIKYLAKEGIPIDMVLGTSIGGLVGGLYAMGYDADYLDSLVHVIDWTNSMTDKVPREYISYERMKYKEKYAVSFPFYYSQKEYKKQREITMMYTPLKKNEKLHLGADKGDVAFEARANILESLPSGLIFGQNVSNIFSSLTVGYQDSTAFYDLPVPFVCVATELVTADAKVWYDGKINKALRSTMSIPGFFSPVRTDGMVLVDGGMRNNYPTDIARKLGADIVIGVDLSSGYGDYSTINNLGDIVIQGVNMLGRASYEKNVSVPDITIFPDLSEYNMMSFEQASMDSIVVRGYRAAEEQKENINLLKSLVRGATPQIQNIRAIDINRTPVAISSVEMVGVDDNESQYLMSKVGLIAGQILDRKRIEDAVATVFGTGAFDYVNYELVGKKEPFKLRFICNKGPVHQAGFSVRYDTEENLSILANVGLNAHKLQGMSYDFTAKLGTNPFFDAKAAFVFKNGLTMNALLRFAYNDRNRFTYGNDVYKTTYANFRQELYLSNIKWANFNFRLGLKSDYFNVGSLLGENLRGDFPNYHLRCYDFGFVTSGRVDTFDDGYFPKKGISCGVRYNFAIPVGTSIKDPLHIAEADVKTVLPVGKIFSFIPSLRARWSFGGSVPLKYMNCMGGTLPGRYFEQQMPFIGINNMAVMPDFLTVLKTDFRFQLLQNNYFTAIFNYAAAFDSFSNLDDYEGFSGVGIEYSYYTVAGPISFLMHWSDYSNRLGLYLSFGFNF